jgi:genome maintenance exonuclease 1
MFEHRLFPKPNLERIEKEGKRFYVTPEGEVYPSVTTLLGAYFQKDLTAWKDKVGHDQAEAITNRAALRGTRLHNICERYLLNEENCTKGAMPSTVSDFLSLKPILNDHVREVYGIEFPVFSKKLKVAGVTDLACTWDGVPSIVDFKTSRKNKKEEWILNYFCQTTAYAIALNEQSALDIKQVVIILLVEHEYPCVFVRKTEKYEQLVNNICIQNRPVV